MNHESWDIFQQQKYKYKKVVTVRYGRLLFGERVLITAQVEVIHGETGQQVGHETLQHKSAAPITHTALQGACRTRHKRPVPHRSPTNNDGKAQPLM